MTTKARTNEIRTWLRDFPDSDDTPRMRNALLEVLNGTCDEDDVAGLHRDVRRLTVNNATLADLIMLVGKSFGLPPDGFTTTALVDKMHELHTAFQAITARLDEHEAKEVTCPKCGARSNLLGFTSHTCVEVAEALLDPVVVRREVEGLQDTIMDLRRELAEKEKELAEEESAAVDADRDIACGLRRERVLSERVKAVVGRLLEIFSRATMLDGFMSLLRVGDLNDANMLMSFATTGVDPTGGPGDHRARLVSDPPPGQEVVAAVLLEEAKRALSPATEEGDATRRERDQLKAALSELSSAITRGTHAALSVKEMLALIADDHAGADRVRRELAEQRAEEDREATVNASYITAANARAEEASERACTLEDEIGEMRKRMLAALGVTEPVTDLLPHEKPPDQPTYAELASDLEEAEEQNEVWSAKYEERMEELAALRALAASNAKAVEVIGGLLRAEGSVSGHDPASEAIHLVKEVIDMRAWSRKRIDWLELERDKLMTHATLPAQWNGQHADAGRLVGLYCSDIMTHATVGERVLAGVVRQLLADYETLTRQCDQALHTIDERDLEITALRTAQAADPLKRIGELNVTLSKWVEAAMEIYRTAGRPPVETTSPSELRSVVIDELKSLAYYKRRETEMLGQLGAWRALRGGKTLDVVFDSPPGPHAHSCRFVEAEVDGRSVKIGEWVARPDGFHALRIPIFTRASG